MTDSMIASIDANTLLRHLLQDHDDHSPRASALLLAVRQGQRKIYCPATGIFEAIHVLHGRAGLPRTDIARALTNLIALPNFVMADEGAVLNALAFWRQQPPLEFADGCI